MTQLKMFRAAVFYFIQKDFDQAAHLTTYMLSRGRVRDAVSVTTNFQTRVSSQYIVDVEK